MNIFFSLKQYLVKAVYAYLRNFYIALVLWILFCLLAGDYVSLQKISIHFYCTDAFGNTLAGSDVSPHLRSLQVFANQTAKALIYDANNLRTTLISYENITFAGQMVKSHALATKLLSCWVQVVPYSHLVYYFFIIIMFPMFLGTYMSCVVLLITVANIVGLELLFQKTPYFANVIFYIASTDSGSLYRIMSSTVTLYLISCGAFSCNIKGIELHYCIFWNYLNDIGNRINGSSFEEAITWDYHPDSRFLKLFCGWHPFSFTNGIALVCLLILVLSLYIIIEAFRPEHRSVCWAIYKCVSVFVLVSPSIIVILSITNCAIHLVYLWSVVLCLLPIILVSYHLPKTTFCIENTWALHLTIVFIYLLVAFIFAIFFYVLSIFWFISWY